MTIPNRVRHTIFAGVLAALLTALVATPGSAAVTTTGRPTVADDGTWATVDTGDANLDMNVRSCAALGCGLADTVKDGTAVFIGCYVYGEYVSGNFGWSNIWDFLPDYGDFASDTNIYTGSNGPPPNTPYCPFS
jgi:hypothetical protein